MATKENNKVKKKTNIHQGHRRRLLKTAYEGDFSSLSIYQQVEVLLFFILPRKDVNPLSHALVDNYKTFAAIMDADPDDIKSIKGIGEDSVINMKVLKKLFQNYADSKVANKVSIKTVAELCDCIEDLLRFSDVEETILISLNKNYVCNGIKRISRGDEKSVKVEVKKVYNFIDSFKASTVIIAHNHPEGPCTPSSGDIETYEHLNHAINTYGCILYDSIIIGDDGMFSMAKKTFLREYKIYTYSEAIEKYITSSIT